MDELTLKVLTPEIGRALAGCRVRGVHVSAKGVFLFFYNGGGHSKLLLIYPGDRGAAFLAPSKETVKGGRRRSVLEDATFISCRQWQDDRVLIFDLAKANRLFHLVVEFFGHVGGCTVVEGEEVLEVFVGRRRQGEKFVYPTRGREENGDLGKVPYMSPLAAKAIYRGPAGEEVPARMAAFRAVAAGDNPAPVAVKMGGRWVPFPCDIFGDEVEDKRAHDTMMAAVKFSFEENAAAEEFVRARAAIESRLRAQIKRISRLRDALRREREEYNRADEYRRMGEALKYNLKAVPAGASEITLPDPFGEGKVVVALKPGLTPQENVARLFKLYRKASRGAGLAAARLAAVEEEIVRLQGQLEALSGARDMADLKPWLDEKKPEAKAAAVKGRRFVSSDGYLVFVGRNAAENEYLTFNFARPHDLWLHAEQAAGAHVIIRRDDKNVPVPRRTIEEAAALAAAFSAAKNSSLVPVVVCERRFVRRFKREKGLVTYSRGEVLFVSPAGIRKTGVEG